VHLNSIKEFAEREEKLCRLTVLMEEMEEDLVEIGEK